jgi:hypothetical protein
MLRVTLFTRLLAALALAACAKNDPVDENAVAPADGLVGDASASGLAAPANAAAAAVASQQAGLPPAMSGLTWRYRPADHMALFGPPGTPAFSIQCQMQREGAKELLFVRSIPPVTGGQGTLSFTGNGQIASVPISAVSSPTGLGGDWRAVVAPDEIARGVAETFAGPGTVEVSITGYPPLVVPSTAEPRRALAECLGG